MGAHDSHKKNNLPATRAEFFGLAGKLDQILEYLHYGGESPILVHGAMGVGKSRLVQAVREYLLDSTYKGINNLHYQFFDVIAGSIPNRHRFATEIWSGLLRLAQAKYGELPNELRRFDFGNESTDQSFLGYLDLFRIHFPGNNFLVIIEDFHKVFSSNEVPASTYRGIVSLMMAIKAYCSPLSEQFKLKFMLSMQWRVPLLDATGLKPRTVRLGPLKEDDFRLMCKELDKEGRISESDRDWLFKYTRGIPFFTTLILDYLPIKKTHTSLGADVKRTIESLSNSAEFETWYTSLREDEQYILSWIIAEDGRITESALRKLNDARRNAFFDLKAMGYIERKSEDYRISVSCVEEFLRNSDKLKNRLDEFRVTVATEFIETPKEQRGIIIQVASQSVYVDGHLLKDIPNKEYRALFCLAERPNQWVSTINVLIPYVYELKETSEENEIFYDGAIKQVIARLRKIMGPGRKYLLTKSGFGYGLFNVEVKIIS